MFDQAAFRRRLLLPFDAGDLDLPVERPLLVRRLPLADDRRGRLVATTLRSTAATNWLSASSL